MALSSTDPVCLPLDSDGDLDVIAFQSTGLSSGVRAVAEGIRKRLLLIRGEWFLDQAVGMPYFERPGVPASVALLGGKYNESKVLDACREAILATPGVVRIEALAATFDGATRRVSVTWQVRCTFGDLVDETLDLGASNA